jgi:predicted Rossmann-fold nucleotide-binding protein
LGQIDSPIIILNTRGYYDPFVEMMKRAEEERFMLPDLHQVWQVVSHPEEIVPAILSTEKVRLDISKQGTLR